MNKIVKAERVTQNRIIALFASDKLGYNKLGNWEDRDNNSNIEELELKEFLKKTGKYSDEIIKKAILALQKEAKINRDDDLYTINKAFYSRLRYGIPIKTDEQHQAEIVQFIDWQNPINNNFAVAEEVTIKGSKERRPDIVIYINGIAIGVLELKKSSVSVSEGIRQNLSNQLDHFNKPFFTTVQLVLAGNDSNGLYYGTTKTEEKYFLKWKEENVNYDPNENLLDRQIKQFFAKDRLLDILHNFIIFDFGIKKLCRPNQYFGIKAAQKYLAKNEGGIIWHTQGSGKSLTMVWLAKWILENKHQARILIITDRTELDEQIESVFSGVEEKIIRTQSGSDLLKKLNDPVPRLICSLVHKFGGKEKNDSILDLKDTRDFSIKGDFIVFVDECHRTQSDKLHDAMKTILPENAIFIGFTGTPLLKKDKATTLEQFGSYIHTYKFDEAVKDGVVLDLLYEARDVDQHVVDQKSIDEWFEITTKGMNELPKAELKKQWGTMQKVLSTKSRLEKIVFDIKKDFLTKPRLKDGRGNAILIAPSIYEACRYYEVFQHFDFKKCAIITSFEPNENTIKTEETGKGETEKKKQFEIYKTMLKNYGYNNAEDFEKFAKKKFKEEPANMQLLIVVDKLLTGFDAIHCTYLYIDKQMQDHGLFQAICRTNRLGQEEENNPSYKEFGYIVDYKNLFDSLNKSILDYTSGALDAYSSEDVEGLLTDRLKKAKECLDDAIEALYQLCAPVPMPKGENQYFHYFCGDSENPDDLRTNQEKRLTFYKLVVGLIRAYNNIAAEIIEAGYSQSEADKIKNKVNEYVALRESIKHRSADYIDLKKYEPDMRQMLDMYLNSDPSRVISNFGDASLLQLIVQKGIKYASDALPQNIKNSPTALNETIENNMRKAIIEQMPTNPTYFEKMSVLLLELVRLRKNNAIKYEELLKKYEDLASQLQPEGKKSYPDKIDSKTKQALYDNLEQNIELAIILDKKIRDKKDHDWRGNQIKKRKVKYIIREELKNFNIDNEAKVDEILELVVNQSDY